MPFCFGFAWSLEFGSPIAARRGPPMARAVESMNAAAYGAVRPPDQVDFGIDGLPAFSPNALALLTAARDEAAARGHPGVGTEHVLWALVQPGCGARVKGWLGEQMQPRRLAATTGRHTCWRGSMPTRCGRRLALRRSSRRPSRLPWWKSLAWCGVCHGAGPRRRRADCRWPGGDGVPDCAILLHGINVCSELLGRASRRTRQLLDNL